MTESRPSGVFLGLDLEENMCLVKKGREPRLHRLTLRVPVRIHDAIVPVATEDGRYVSDWIVVVLQQAVAQHDPTRPIVLSTWWRRNQEQVRLTVRTPVSLRDALEKIAGRDNITRWVIPVLEQALRNRGVKL